MAFGVNIGSGSVGTVVVVLPNLQSQQIVTAYDGEVINSVPVNPILPQISIDVTPSGGTTSTVIDGEQYSWSNSEFTLFQTYLFTATVSIDPDLDITEYTWDFGDGVTALGPSVYHTYRVPNPDTVVRVTTKDTLGRTAYGLKTLTLIPAPLGPLITHRGAVLHP